MEKMKQIQSKEDFLKWARDVNYTMESRKNNICDLQDVFARSGNGKMDELKAMFLGASETEKQLLTFSITKAMGEETAYRFIKAWARKQANICIDESQKDIEEEYKKLSNDRMTFLIEKKTFDAQLPALQKEIEMLKELVRHNNIRNDSLNETNCNLQTTINTQNKDLDEAHKTINETVKFKQYLKTILHPEEL